MKSDKLFSRCINQKKSPEKYAITSLNQYKYNKWILYL